MFSPPAACRMARNALAFVSISSRAPRIVLVASSVDSTTASSSPADPLHSLPGILRVVERRDLLLRPGDRIFHHVEFGAHREGLVELLPAGFDGLDRARLRDTAKLLDRREDLIELHVVGAGTLLGVRDLHDGSHACQTRGCLRCGSASCSSGMISRQE